MQMENQFPANLPSDEELTRIYKEANNEVGKARPLTTTNIFRAMKAAILHDRSVRQMRISNNMGDTHVNKATNS